MKTYTLEKQNQKFFIGFLLRTSNQEMASTAAAHWEKFHKESILDQIPNKTNNHILALYTDYEGDYTKPFSYLIGCEVSTLATVPPGLTGKVIPVSTYAVFTAQGEFPQALVTAWQTIWTSSLNRSYTNDFELYDLAESTKAKVYIAL